MKKREIKKAVAEILDKLCDRAGFDDWYFNLDDVTEEEIEKESEELYNRYRAFFDMQSLQYDDEDFEDAKKRYMDRDPYADADKRREDLVEEFGPRILPEA